MIFTELSYFEFGKQIIATGFFTFFACVLMYRFILGFRHYIHHGDFGDPAKTAFVQLMEGKDLHKIIKYGLTGYHPITSLIDVLIFSLFSFLSAMLWGAMIPIICIVLLGYVMRKRIATKQEFVAKLNGTHKNG